ncbi:MAG TPA: nuclear transport factor 2 family protein [Acidimicrobiales bacterium]
MPTAQQLRQAMERYAEAASARDVERYVALFTPDAVQVDPYPTGVHKGRDEIRAFMKQSFDACEAMRFEVEECHPVADKAAVRFHITLGLEGGATMHIRGVEIFTITEGGLISAVEAYWGEEDVTLG